MAENGNGYWTGAVITGALTFVACYIYCISQYGFLLGVGLGWLPSAIAAFFVGLLWPVILLAAVAVGYLVSRSTHH